MLYIKALWPHPVMTEGGEQRFLGGFSFSGNGLASMAYLSRLRPIPMTIPGLLSISYSGSANERMGYTGFFVAHSLRFGHL